MQGVEAQAHVVERNVVFPYRLAGDGVVAEGLGEVADSVEEAAYLEGDVLLLVELGVVRPDAGDAAAEVVAELAGSRSHLVQNRVSELVKHVRVPVAQLEQGDDALQGRVRRVFLDALLHDEEVVGAEAAKSGLDKDGDGDGDGDGEE